MEASEQDLSAWVGRSETRSDMASALTAARMAGLLDRDAPSSGDAWPATWIWAMFWPALRHDQAGRDGHAAKGGFLPPIDLPMRMWAGSDIEIEQPLRVGEGARRISTIEDIAQKSGRSGRLVFVTIGHRIEGDQGGLMRETQRLAYREPPQANPTCAVRSESGPGFEPLWFRDCLPDPVLLFQYSAVTYNTHRIHYDHPYATGVENYPGLVVHGPLAATLLMDLLDANSQGAAPRRFSIRALAPLFAPATFRLLGRRDGHAFRLAAADGNSNVAMTIEGEFAQ